MSGHGSHLVESLDYAIDHDLVDVVLVAFSFAQDPDFYAKVKHTLHFVALQEDLPRVLRKARERDVGVIAMKTLMGARLNDMRPYERGGGTFSQAAFRWALSQPFVDALAITMTSRELIDEYVGASGDPLLSSHDLHLLELYAHLQAGRYCWHGCGVCEASCPHGVEIAEVLRARMYDVDYRDRAVAATEYAGIGRNASACLRCAEQPCLGACPVGLPVACFTRDAAARLA
jgi:predicted aldo/keto reductase-like oxidoreductase